MTDRPPPFTCWPSGRLRPVEETSRLDASELAWFGVLDGVFDFNASPWTAWVERELSLQARGWNREALRPVRGMVCLEGADRVSVKLTFEVVADAQATSVRQEWREVFRLVAVPCPFGGSRWWFACAWCGRRRAHLYRTRGSAWRCRECAALTYETQQVHGLDDFSVSGWRFLFAALAIDESRAAAQGRRNLRRRLSRWRRSARTREDCRLAWPIQVSDHSPTLSAT